MSKCVKCGRKAAVTTEKPLWKKILPIALIVTFLAAVGYAVYYFFFSDNYEDLDEDFFYDDLKVEEPAGEEAENVEKKEEQEEA